MNRNEFLNKLEEELSESFNKSEINKQLDYYSKYIDDEVKKGRTEPEVLSELGDPRLIVKTLKTINRKEGIVSDDDNSNSSNGREYGGSEETNNTKRRTTYYQPIMGNNGTIGCIIFLLIFFIIGSSVLRLMGTIVTGTVGLFFASPVFFILLVFIIYNLFKNRQ